MAGDHVVVTVVDFNGRVYSDVALVCQFSSAEGNEIFPSQQGVCKTTHVVAGRSYGLQVVKPQEKRSLGAEFLGASEFTAPGEFLLVRRGPQRVADTNIEYSNGSRLRPEFEKEPYRLFTFSPKSTHWATVSVANPQADPATVIVRCLLDHDRFGTADIWTVTGSQVISGRESLDFTCMFPPQASIQSDYSFGWEVLELKGDICLRRDSYWTDDHFHGVWGADVLRSTPLPCLVVEYE